MRKEMCGNARQDTHFEYKDQSTHYSGLFLAILHDLITLDCFVRASLRILSRAVPSKLSITPGFELRPFDSGRAVA
jgi:hypothetical protein